MGSIRAPIWRSWQATFSKDPGDQAAVWHGTLHLLGYDHETAEDARVMEARERELLTALGFDDPYLEGV